MKTIYLKTVCKASVILFIVLLCQQVFAASISTPLLKIQVGRPDTPQRQLPGHLKRVKKIKNEEKDMEDGVSDDIRARAAQEFMQKRDPRLNKVPVERLLTARKLRDQFVKANLAKGRLTPQGNVVNGGALPPGAPLNGMQWHERGANNVGGRTRALMFDMNDAANGYKKVFAGGVGGGLWYTTDITATPVQWNKIDDFFDNIAISCIVQNPLNPQEIYAGTGEGFLNADAIQGLGVWKSSDGGANWTHLTSTTGFKYINSILVDRNGSVYIAGETDIFVGFGVYKSSDGGSSWTNVINSSEAGADLQLAANGDIYASTGVIFLNGHIYVSDFKANGANTGNAGTWTNITPSTTGVITPSTTSWFRIKLAVAPSDSATVYAFFEGSGGSQTAVTSVQRYNRLTNTWTVKTVPPTSFSNGQGWYSIAIGVDPNDANVLYAGSLDASKSINGGTSWAHVTLWSANTSASNYVHADHHAYVYAPGSSTRLLMGTDGGIFYTVNANATPSFVNKNNGYDVTQYYSVALHPTSFNYALAGAQDNGSQAFSSPGLGPTTEVTGGDGAFTFIDQTNGNIQITSYVYDQYFLSTNNGASFSGLGSFGNGSFINPTDYDPSTKNIYAGSASGFFYRAANVLSPAYNEVSVSAFNGANITSVNVAPVTANRVYFGLDNGTVVLVDGANTGTSLAGVILHPNGGTAANVSCVAVDPTNENHILVAYSNYGVTHVVETKNASAVPDVWTSVDGNLPDMPVRWVMFHPDAPTKALIATELGVWTTELINGGSTTWDPSNTGLANVEVDMLKYRPADRTIAAATHGRGLFTATLPTITATPTLSNLVISAGTLTPAFASGTVAYKATVSGATTSITVTPTASDPSSTIKVKGIAVASGTASAPIALAPGFNTIKTVVTASDGTTTNTYTLTVKRTASTNADLSNLHLSTGALTPAFAAATTSYTASVSNGTTSITVTPTTADAGATVTVNGTTVASGSASGSLPLAVGPNTITTVVTAQDGTTTKTYTVTVTRAVSSNANLASLHLSSVALSPAFSGATTTYTANVGNAITSTMVTPITADAGATVTVNGTTVASGSASASLHLAPGPNVITTVVTAQDGTTTKTYTVTVTRAASAVATLSNLHLSAGTLAPAFASTTVTYTASVGNGITSITVTPTVTDPDATIKVNGTTVASGTASPSQPLAVGANIINTVVTASNGTSTKTYKVTVTRALSPNANLANLKASSGALTPAFATATTSYTQSVSNSVSSVTLTPTVAQANATVTVNGTAVASGSPSGSLPLAVGPNTLTTVVTAQDGTTTKTYTITVTRASGPVNIPDVAMQPAKPQPTDDGIVIHQGISPNGDGINDIFMIDGISKYPDNKLVIMNRNGSLVFEAKGYDNASKRFDGHSNKTGQMQLPGTYFYSLDYVTGGITIHKTGYIVLKY